MSFNESHERDRALAIATVANRTTPEDATRSLIQVLSHLIPTAQANEFEKHIAEGCSICTRALVWLPILEGSLT